MPDIVHGVTNTRWLHRNTILCNPHYTQRRGHYVTKRANKFLTEASDTSKSSVIVGTSRTTRATPVHRLIQLSYFELINRCRFLVEISRLSADLINKLTYLIDALENYGRLVEISSIVWDNVTRGRPRLWAAADKNSRKQSFIYEQEKIDCL